MFAFASSESGIFSSSYGPPGMRCIKVNVMTDTSSRTPKSPASRVRTYRAKGSLRIGADLKLAVERTSSSTTE
jgi:hypothetical protein